MADLLLIFSVIFLGILFIINVAYILQRKLVDSCFSVKPDYNNQKPRYPKPSDELIHQIETIQPSCDFDIEYRPCIVTLVDGRRIDCVYVIHEEPYIKKWGVWPENDRGKYSFRIQDITKIEESPSRLPSRIANELYQSGETGMGSNCFTINFNDHTQQGYMTGSLVDFIPLPEGKTKSDIIGVMPGVASGKSYFQGLKYYWCLYSS